jgi:hypothetical protein
MAYPDKPEQSFSYTAHEQSLGDGSFPGQELDVDLADLRASADGLIEFLKLLARSDGKLANGSVTRDSLAADILLGVEPPTPWTTAIDYKIGDSVFESNKFYICASDHTSSVFANDLASGRWTLLADYASIITEFNSVYLGAKAVEPTVDNLGNPLIDGALYYNTITARMRVYDDPDWIDVAVNFTQNREVYTATGGQTVFAVSYTPPFVDVWLNGLKLVNGVDFTALTGTEITLASGAAGGDDVDIIAYGVFTIADALRPSQNLADLTEPATALANLGVTATAAELNVLDGVTGLLGWGQTWQDVTGSRAYATSYQNTTGRPISVSVQTGNNSGSLTSYDFDVSTDNSTWLTIARGDTSTDKNYAFSGALIVPNGIYYRVTRSGPNTAAITSWAELR